jgi:hypothetical protein
MKKAIGTPVLLAAAITCFLTGCDEDGIFIGCPAPHAPVNVASQTGDGEVTVFWTMQDPDLTTGFVVYRSRQPDDGYYAIGETGNEYFVDRSVNNGVTYYYAVTSLGECGTESDLSWEIAYDTPRPEGYGERLYDANGRDWHRSAWDFSTYRAMAWDSPAADIWFIVEDGVAYLVATDLDTDIQDAGFVRFEDLGWSPADGWSPSGAVEAIAGHCYLVWTRDNHFAKVRLVSVNGSRIEFDWAYQTDPGNQELKPRQRDGSGATALKPGTGGAGGVGIS